MLISNSTNINKTNNHLSPQIINPKKTTTYEVGNPGPFLGQTQKYLDFFLMKLYFSCNIMLVQKSYSPFLRLSAKNYMKYNFTFSKSFSQRKYKFTTFCTNIYCHYLRLNEWQASFSCFQMFTQ